MQNYLVPTPLVLANSSKILRSDPCDTGPSKQLDYNHNQKPAAPPLPVDVNVVIPPPTKPRDPLGRTTEGALPRGPLSYEALVHLRKSASTKKTPLCPTIDHTIDLKRHLPVSGEDPKPEFERSHSQAPLSKTGPPVVAPKPKIIPANVSVKRPNQASITSESSQKVKNAPDPQVVRMEALQKLGLLKEEPENEAVALQPPPKPQSSLDPAPNRFTRGPSNVNPSRSPSFCCSQVPSELKNRPLQSSASFHHQSRHDQHLLSASHPSQSTGSKAATLEHSASLDIQTNGEYCSKPLHTTTTKPAKPTTAAQPGPQKALNTVGYTVMVVPGMGADRKEALRKLGLLKHWRWWAAEVCLLMYSTKRLQD